MGPLPQHSAMEFSRYINRTALLLPSLYNMQAILRTPRDQYETFIEPMAAWLEQQGVKIAFQAYVTDLRFAASPDPLTVVALDYQCAEAAPRVPVADGDIVLVTLGSQIEGMLVGSTPRRPPGQAKRPSSVALWRKLAAAHQGLGDPDAFFDPSRVGDTRWVMFTVTTSSTVFQDLLAALTTSPSGTGGIVTLKDLPWLISLTVFHQPEVVDQSDDIWVWWGYGLHPEQNGATFGKPMNQCTGAEILEEVVRQLKFDADLQGDLGVLELRALRLALREQHLAALQARRPPGRGAAPRDQSWIGRTIRRDAARHRVHHGIFSAHGLGSGLPPAWTRAAAAAGVSGHSRSADAACRASQAALHLADLTQSSPSRARPRT